MLAAVLVMVVLGTSPSAHADDEATARDLFKEGRALLSQGESEEACTKFAESVAAFPSVGPLLNLARCHEQQGKTATAFAEYMHAATLADQAGQSKRAKTARELAAKLEPQLSRLIIKLALKIPGTRVVRDGVEVPAVNFGAPLPVDPGEHALEASAPGYETWSTTVTIGKEGDQQEVIVPALVKVASSGAPEPYDEPGDVVATGTVSGSHSVPVTTAPMAPPLPPPRPPWLPPPPPDKGEPGESGSNVAGYVCFGFAGVGLVVGTAFAIHAFGVKEQYDANPTTELADEGEMATAAADVSFGVALVSGVVGLILLLTGSDDGAHTDAKTAAMPVLRPLAGPGGGGLAVNWSF